MNAPVHTLDGEADGSVELPAVFETTHRPDLVKRAVLAARANDKQDAGTDEYAGLRTPAESQGSGRGMAHVPRQDGRAREVPQAVSGRRSGRTTSRVSTPRCGSSRRRLTKDNEGNST